MENESEKVEKKRLSYKKKYIIFVILLLIITAIACVLTIKYLSKENSQDEIIIIENSIEQPVEKKSAEDKKYTINSYTETYDDNPIRINKHYLVKGVETSEDLYEKSEKERKNYVQIEGLKDRDTENSINERLKQKAIEMDTDDVNTYVAGNFGDVLSVEISGLCKNENDKYITKHDCLNVDLNTGEEIPLEKVFVSSTPIKALIVNGLYKALSWENIYGADEGIIESYDMNKSDTSDYENKSIEVMRKYDNNKDNIDYIISPEKVTILGSLIQDKNGNDISINIDFVDNIDEVSIYKRFLTGNSIYKDSSIGLKKTIVFTKRLENSSNFIDGIKYGKIADNVFDQEILQKNGVNANWSVINKAINEISSKENSETIKNLDSSKGLFIQKEYGVNGSGESNYYKIYVTIAKTICDINYFKNEAFKDFIHLQQQESGAAKLVMFSKELKELYPNLEPEDEAYETYYIGINGEFLGNTEQEAKTKTSSSEYQNIIEQYNPSETKQEQEVNNSSIEEDEEENSTSENITEENKNTINESSN